ncbi:hypothetical protein RND71_013196 [Anisodus tanguticus]|uniref:Protein kinase domain-containing protein n=1 Tax=Anisodus tanguticus TaxID=243964 RepID=A0AAE1SER3_9SOLA|nr:hypothetical protein RND71_013196 [Anisodus tanguticus]
MYVVRMQILSLIREDRKLVSDTLSTMKGEKNAEQEWSLAGKRSVNYGQNILLGKTGAKIADFGCAKWVDPAEKDGGAAASSSEPIGGTPMFMAPEVARGAEQGCPVDIWALGCTIIEMATGGSPWTDVINAPSLLHKIAFCGNPLKFRSSCL